MRKTSIAKRFVTYIAAGVILTGSLFAGASFESSAESYIRYDNIIIRDGANGEIQGGIAKGTEVEIVETATGSDGKQWNHVRYAANGTTHEGWVRADLMTEDKSLIAPDQQQDAAAQTPDEEPASVQPEEPESQEEDPVESIVGDELKVVIPLASVCGEGYVLSGEKEFVVCDKTLTVAEDFSDDVIPKDFEKQEISFGEGQVKGVSYKYGEVDLVFLKDGTGKGEFFVWDNDNQVVYSFIRISAGENSLILLVPSEDESVASSYAKTLYAVDEDTAVVAYQFAQQEELMDIGTNTAEYFYVYGMTKNNLPCWYLLDDVENTYIRATTDLAVELDVLSGEEIVIQDMDASGTLERMINVVVAAILLILFVLAVVFSIRNARARRELYEYENDDEEDDIEEMGFIQRRREERKYRRFMENFEEEGDEDVADILPKKKVEEYLKEQEEAIEDKKPQAQNTDVLPPVDTVILKEIMAEQEAKEAEEMRLALEEAVAKEMSMDDYDIEVSDDEDYDLLDENSEEEENLFAAEPVEEEPVEDGTVEVEATEVELVPEEILNEEVVLEEMPAEEAVEENLAEEAAVGEASAENLAEDSIENLEEDSEEASVEDDEWKELEFLEI